MSGRRVVALAAALGLWGWGGPCAAAGGANTDPSAVPSGTYRIDPAHTQIGFSVMHMGIAPYRGLFSDAAGQLIVDAAHPAASRMYASVGAGSVYTTSPKLTAELNSPQWLDSARFPRISFRTDRVSLDGRGGAQIAGTLTLHGVSRPVTLQAHFVASGQNPLTHLLNLGFTATTTIQRSAFGVSAYVPMVGDDVTLSIVATFVQ